MIDPVTASFVATYTGGVLSNLIKLLIDITVPEFTVTDFFQKTKLNIERLQEFENLLLTVDKVLGDAEEKQITSPSVRRWVDNLRDVAYDAEDLLDAIATEGRRSQLLKDPTKKKQIKDFNNLLETVLKKLNPITKQIDVLGLKEGQGGRLFPRLPTTSLVDNSTATCLRDSEKEKILDFLTNDDSSKEEIPVVSIVGLGGIGKTTLAQFVYNDKRLKNHFDFKVWVYVPGEFDVFKITKTIYESVALGRRYYDSKDLNVQSATIWLSGIEDLDVLQVTLERKLNGKKFLLVLDNVWNMSLRQWDLLLRPLPRQFGQSRIIVTTCSHNVSSTIRSALVHDLKPLSTSLCEILFEKQAFGDEDGDPILRKVGKDIVKKCRGMPLAAETLGGLLRSKVEAEEWENILNSKIWDLPADKSDILPALRLSYHYLPSQLKRCFAYCSIFPKGHKFEKLDLVRMWIAEGLVQLPNRGRTTLEAGLHYFDELISRSIIQQSGDDQSHFIMHDLVNDLTQHIAGEFFFKFEHDSPLPNPARVRYLSCKLKQSGKPDKFAAFYGKSNLRTFLPFSAPSGRSTCFSPVVCNLFPDPSCLRVLSLSSYGSSITKCPDSICNLTQLRYLDLSLAATRFLPEKMHHLYNLETLKLADCDKLEQLPKKLSKLSKLEHLDIKGTRIRKMPPGFGNLKRIQLLTGFVVGEGKNNGSAIIVVNNLCLLRTLSIVQLKNLSLSQLNLNDTGETILKSKEYLRELILDWSHWTPQSDDKVQNVQSAGAAEVLNKLQPGENLEKLELRNFCGLMNFPTWLGNASFSRMKFLTLKNCQNCTSLPPLGQLPSLKALTIEDLPAIKTVGSEFYGTCNLVFKSLETLKFQKMHSWEQWLPLGDNQTGFASLRKLFLVLCDNLPEDHLPYQIPRSKVHRN